MSEDAEAFGAIVRAFLRGDLDAVYELTDPDVVIEPLRAAFQGAYRGHAGVAAYLRDNAESFDAWEPEFERIEDLGDGRLLALGMLRARSKEGVAVEAPMAIVAKLRDGRLVRFKDHGDEDVARAALQGDAVG